MRELEYLKKIFVEESFYLSEHLLNKIFDFLKVKIEEDLIFFAKKYNYKILNINEIAFLIVEEIFKQKKEIEKLM